MILTTEWQPIAYGIHGKRVGEDYTFTTNEVPLTITISNLHEYRGDIRAEVAIIDGSGSLEWPELARERLTITGGNSKSSFANSLINKPALKNCALPWHECMNVMCGSAIDTYRRGEPTLLLADLPVPEADPYLVNKFLPLGQPAVIFGDAESCKSYLALSIALAVASGKSLPNIKVKNSGAVLFLDWETNWQAHRRRLDRLCRGLEMDTPRNLFYRHMTRSLRDDLREIRAELDRRHIKLLILDSIGVACGGQSREEDKALDYFVALRALGEITNLSLHHLPWSEATKEKGVPRMYGSIYIRNSVRSSWAIQKAKAEHQPWAKVLLTHDKANDDTKYPQMGLRFDFTDNATELKWLDPNAVLEFADSISLSSRIRVEMSDGEEWSPDELAGELGESESSVKTVLNRMDDVTNREMGRGRGKKGRWVLISDRMEEGQGIDF